MYDQEVALNLQAQLKAEVEEEEMLARQKEKEANIALIESLDNTQAMMDANYEHYLKKEMKRVNTFVDYKIELMEESLKKATAEKESSSKRAGDELKSDNLKKHKLNKNVEAKVDDDQEEEEMKKHIEDLETLWKLVKAKHGLTRPEDGYERVLWGDLKVMFEPNIESEVWRNL
nr:hypothetical protein [Tanacetum cinerariifolium]